MLVNAAYTDPGNNRADTHGRIELAIDAWCRDRSLSQSGAGDAWYCWYIYARHGRPAGLLLTAGIITGSYIWSITAALGVGAILMAHVWILEAVRYCGAAYLLYLAFRSLRAAMSDTHATMAEMNAPHGYFTAGVMLHLTNPKPVLFFGTLFSIGVPAGTGAADLALVVLVVGLCNGSIFIAYALLLSLIHI